MTKEIKLFNTTEEARKEKKKRRGKWRPLHTDIVNDKFKVTFVNGTDDPANSAEQQQTNAKFQRRKELQAKLDNDIITFDELKEYLRG